jgi:hypothetical protein
MHAVRRFPLCLSGSRSGKARPPAFARFARCALCLLISLLAGCTSPRYVGSIGRDGTYSNRGYGLAIRLDVNGLGERWDAIDPTEREKVPKSVRPKRKTDPIDVDGDGLLSLTERQEHMVPTLRLLSRTSSTARIDIDVLILGGANKTAPIDALVALELKQRVGTSTAGVGEAITKMIRRTVAPDFDARVAEISSSKGYYRIALIDHGDFLAEEGIKRRQMIKVLLSAKRRSDPMVEDHDKLLDAVILNRRGSSTSVREQW